MATSRRRAKNKFTTESKKKDTANKQPWQKEDEKLAKAAPPTSVKLEKPVRQVQISNEVRLSVFKDNSIELYHYDDVLVDLMGMPQKIARKLYKELRSMFEESSKPKKDKKDKKPKRHSEPDYVKARNDPVKHEQDRKKDQPKPKTKMKPSWLKKKKNR